MIPQTRQLHLPGIAAYEGRSGSPRAGLQLLRAGKPTGRLCAAAQPVTADAKVGGYGAPAVAP